MLIRRQYVIALVMLILSAACDPLGNQAQLAAVLPTATPTPIPTVTTSPIPPTLTATPLPPTPIPPSATPRECSDSQGQVLSDKFASKVTRADVPYRIYLPPCYWQTSRRYPYVILFPGADADQTEWTDALHVDKALDQGIAAQTLPPMILVMPAGGELANTNVFTDGRSFESLVINELIPLIDKTFCTWNVREGRAIGGISRGGFWAYEIGLRHAPLFDAVGGHSATFDKTAMPAAYNPLNLATTVKFAAGLQPRFWLDVGKDDAARPLIETLQSELTARGINPGYTLNPLGAHDVAYWSAHVADYLAFYGQTWPHSASELPSCLQ